MRKFLLFLLIIIVGASLFNNCAKSPNYPDEPEIGFVGFSKTTLRQGSINNDSTFLTISFRDGDGDLGLDETVLETNLFLLDNRTGELYNQYKTPLIPEEGVGNGVEGEMRILLFTTCCTFPDNIPPCESPDLYPTDEITFDVYIEDRAGNQSNVITTPPLTLLCN